MSDDAAATLSNPILNGPYDPPSRYFEIGPTGPTGAILAGRRPSESYLPIVRTKKRGVRSAADPDSQGELEFGLTGERPDKNTLINDLRREALRAGDVGLLRGEDFKKAGAGNLFTVFGEPDIVLHREDGRCAVELLGVDVYDPTTGEVCSDDISRIAVKVITDYCDEVMKVFEVR